jgi:hypothetical protein
MLLHQDEHGHVQSSLPDEADESLDRALRLSTDHSTITQPKLASLLIAERASAVPALTVVE